MWILSRTGRVEVNGDSMRPTLAAGDRLLVLERGGPWRRPRPGDIVVLGDPRSARPLVKRATRVVADGVVVAGDNPAESTDSRTFGAVPQSAVTGRAVYRYAPTDRAGRL